MQHETLNMDRLTALQGAPVYDSVGEQIGSVDEIFCDNDSGRPEWIGIGTGFFGMKRVLVPVEGASTSQDGIAVPYGKGQVKDAPNVSADDVDEDTERQLYSHYGLSASDRRSDSVLPDRGTQPGLAGRDSETAHDDVDEQSVTRSEEELRVGKREVDTGAVRLRKWVETEPVTENVELRRETAHVHREPINEPARPGAEIGEQTIDVPLRGEEAVVDKQVVAKERVALDKDVDTRTETVTDEVRKERVETNGDIDPESTSNR